jgi:predicted choloylglycine hydrolase
MEYIKYLLIIILLT